MGALSCCIQGKPEKETQPTVSEMDNDKNSLVQTNILAQENSLKPWNRKSLQIYCGDPQPEKDKDKPPDDSPSPPSVSQNHLTVDNDHNPLTFGGQINNTNNDDVQGNWFLHHVQDSEIDTESESNDCMPDIIIEPDKYLHTLRYNPPPHIEPVDPSSAITRRPKSLDSSVPRGPKKKSRPLSYSPGILKTKQPVTVNSALTAALDLPQKRPHTIDMVAFFDAKGFDIHTQKLRKILIQEYHERFRGSLITKNIDQVTRNIVSPNQVKYLDEGPNRYFQLSQMISRKSKNRDMKLKEVNYLKKAVSRPRMKFSKSLEIIFQHCEQYFEHDPFLDVHATQPSNPWMTDDETMWEINKAMVDVPPIKRINMWALSFEDLLRDEKGRSEFEKFLQKEYSQENIRFYKACMELVACPQSEVSSRIRSIEKEFLTRGAVCEVNVDCKTLDLVMQQLKSNNLNRFIFQPAMEHVYALMKKDSYTRFLRSDQYKQLIFETQTHYTKKKFFNFGSNRKKNPSPMVHRRGSASSDGVGADGTINGGSFHSFSTGNLKDLADQQKNVDRSNISPQLRRKTENMQEMVIDNNQDNRRRSNLRVSRDSFVIIDKSQCTSVAIPTPRTNIVTPWEGPS